MTVEELIEQLRRMDPKKEVLIDDDEYGPKTISDVQNESVLAEEDCCRAFLSSFSAVWLLPGLLYKPKD